MKQTSEAEQEKPAAKPVKYIAGGDFQALRLARKAADKERKRFTRWLERQCARKDVACYLHQLHYREGFVLDGTANQLPDGSIYYTEATRRPVPEGVVVRARSRDDKIARMIEAVEDLIDRLAEAYNTRPRWIDLKTGELKAPPAEEIADKPRLAEAALKAVLTEAQDWDEDEES